MKKLNFKKIFCFISFLFILSCCVYYGTRFLKLYVENKKELSKEVNSLAKIIKENNKENENFTELNKELYFIGKSENNYLEYSGLTWRIIKVSEDNSITAITDNSISSLAFGKEKTFTESYINKWLNNTEEEYSGILEKSLNSPMTYLEKTTICLDTIEKINNNECQKTNKDYYFSLLSTKDLANVGKESYLSNGEFYYLEALNDSKEIYYFSDEGKITTSKGNDLFGIRPVITIRANIDYQKGDGTENNPYTIETTKSLFGSYVKLDNELWRIYQVNDEEVRLVLNSLLKVNNNEITYKYSNINNYHDDTKNGSIAYYLNHDFLNSLSYKDKIKEVYWSNGYYNSATDYDYTTAIKDTINTKIALISITDIRFNKLSNYYTLTGNVSKGNQVFTITDNGKIKTKTISNELNVVPAISLEKTLLTKGTGSKEDPYQLGD